MCDGGYDGDGYGDPDYYDLEFREQNPDIYGDDEYMQSFQSSRRYNIRTRKRTPSIADKQFHEEYLRWKRNHPERVEFFRSPSVKDINKRISKSTSIWPNIIAALIIYPIVIALIINACSN